MREGTAGKEVLHGSGKNKRTDRTVAPEALAKNNITRRESIITKNITAIIKNSIDIQMIIIKAIKRVNKKI